MRGQGDTLIRDLSPKTLAAEVEGSLRRLETDCIDLYQCHWPDPSRPIEQTWEYCAALVSQGKVRYLGLSNHSAEDIARAHAIHPVYAVQSPYNILRREVETEVIPLCQKENIRFLAYSPMQSGLLSGSFRLEALSPDDWRRRKPAWYSEPNVGVFLNLVAEIESIARAREATVGQIVVAWCLRKGGATAAIVGARDANQARNNQAAQQIILNNDEIKQIEVWADNALNKVKELADV